MQKSRIEWTDYTINPIKGMCPVDCKDNHGKSYCYARRMYQRFKWNSEIRFDVASTKILKKTKPGDKIFWGSTMELFGNWIKDHWLLDIFTLCRIFDDRTHIFLTKQPRNMVKWFPNRDNGGHENCWAGVSVTDTVSMGEAMWLDGLWSPVKFISLEPLLGSISKEYLKQISWRLADWLIIGQQTPPSKKTEPKIEWIREIVEAADAAGIPVFLKDNLKPLLLKTALNDNRFWADKRDKNGFENCHTELRQEFPR